MALNPAPISASLLSASAIQGFQWPLICQGVGIAMTEWTVAGGVTLSGVAVGGFGPVTGLKVFLPPSAALVMAGLASAGLVGQKAVEIAAAVSVGLSVAVSGYGSYVGVAPSVPLGSTGTDASKIVSANSPMLCGLLTASFASVGLLGPSAAELAVGLSQGISLMMLTGTGIGVVLGPGTGGATVSTLI